MDRFAESLDETLNFSSPEQPSSGCALHRTLVDVLTSLLGISARLQPERHPKGLQGHVGEHGCADGVCQARDEDHYRSDGSAPQPGEVHQLFDPSPGVYQNWRWRRLVTPLLRDRGGRTGSASRS